MKRGIFLLLPVLLLILAGCTPAEEPEPVTLPPTTVTETTPALPLPTQTETSPQTTTPVLELTAEEQNMLLKIGMAELGETECIECIALVMRTVLNRVDADRFGSTIKSVLFSENQFTPVSDGTYHQAVPNSSCYGALELVMSGWDESQGALYYEFCEGESWHSQNLELLFQHCNTRFYK